MILLHGAYGKHYDNLEAVKAAWENGTDFAIAFHDGNSRIGRYCSIRDWAFMIEEFGKVIISYGHDNYWEAE